MGSHGSPRVEERNRELEEQNRELEERFQELEGRNRELEERNRELEDETGRPRTAAESAADNSNVSFGLPMDLSQNMGAAPNTNWLIDTGMGSALGNEMSTRKVVMTTVNSAIASTGGRGCPRLYN